MSWASLPGAGAALSALPKLPSSRQALEEAYRLFYEEVRCLIHLIDLL